MKWKSLFSSYKAVNYTISSVSGNNYIFGFLNVEAKLKGVDSIFDREINYTFSKRKINQSEVNNQMKWFLEDMSSGFWLDFGSFRQKSINWSTGPKLYIHGICYTNPSGGIIEEDERIIDLENSYAQFDINFDRLSFTEIVGLYLEFSQLDDLSRAKYLLVLDALKITMYEYLWSTNWFYRRKVLKILNDEPFNLSYRDLEEEFIYIEHNNWKNREMK